MGSIIKIASKSRSIHNTISYMLNKQEDSELVTGIGVSNDLNAIEDFKRTNEIFGDKGKIKLWHFTQSFDPLEDISAEKAHELGVKWAEKMFPNQSILVVTHTDKGHVHNHFGISPNDQQTGKKMDIRKNDIRVLQAWNDNILIDNGISPLDMYKYNHLVADREKWKEREFRTENKISNREKIKLAVSEVAQYAKNYDDFHAELKKKHSIETYQFAKNQRIGYKLLDSEGGLILKIGGKRLGQNYDMNYLDDLFTENKKAEQIQSEEVLTEIAIRHLGKSLNGRADSRINWQERAQRFELDNENIPFLRSSKDYEEFYDKYKFEIEDRIEILLDVFGENKDQFFGFAVEEEPLKYKKKCVDLVYKKVVYDISESLSIDYDQFNVHDTKPALERNFKKRYIQETKRVLYLFHRAIDDGTIEKARREYEETAREIDYQKRKNQYDMDF